MDTVLTTLLNNVKLHFDTNTQYISEAKPIFTFIEQLTIDLYDTIENKNNIIPMTNPVEEHDGVIYKASTCNRFVFTKNYDKVEVPCACPNCGHAMPFNVDKKDREIIIKFLSSEINDIRNSFTIFRPYILVSVMRAISEDSFEPLLGFRTRYGIT